MKYIPRNVGPFLAWQKIDGRNGSSAVLYAVLNLTLPVTTLVGFDAQISTNERLVAFEDYSENVLRRVLR